MFIKITIQLLGQSGRRNCLREVSKKLLYVLKALNTSVYQMWI